MIDPQQLETESYGQSKMLSNQTSLLKLLYTKHKKYT